MRQKIYDLEKVRKHSFATMAKAVDLQVVPEIYRSTVLLNNVQEILAMSDGPSIHNPIREGIVWKQLNGTQFKAISNKYLDKQD